MKKLLPLFCAPGCFSQTVLADNKNFALESDKTGAAKSYSGKLGFRF
jgi:hypothetical protein